MISDLLSVTFLFLMFSLILLFVFLGTFSKLHKAITDFFTSVCLSACLSVLQSASNSAAPTGRILMKFDILGFFENQLREPKIWSKCHKNNRYCT